LRAALELFALAADRSNPEIPLRAADITKGWCILAWNEPQTRYTFGTTDLSGQLDRLEIIIGHVAETSQKIATANLIPERNTPVTFQGAPPPAQMVAPAASAKKSKR